MAEQDVFQHLLKVPRDRIAVLIGEKGKIKREIEDKTKTDLDIESETGDVTITGHDGLNIYTAKEVVQAISRGFNPRTAMLLLKGDYVFESVDISDFGNTKNSRIRLKGRIIGEEGKARRVIEDLTECHISVYGKTACIIGEPEEAAAAKQAIVSLLQGATHSSVYRTLEKKRKVKKQEQMFDLSNATETN
jgi:ribosomal RNA assembly protein